MVELKLEIYLARRKLIVLQLHFPLWIFFKLFFPDLIPLFSDLLSSFSDWLM